MGRAGRAQTALIVLCVLITTACFLVEAATAKNGQWGSLGVQQQQEAALHGRRLAAASAGTNTGPKQPQQPASALKTGSHGVNDRSRGWLQPRDGTGSKATGAAAGAAAALNTRYTTRSTWEGDGEYGEAPAPAPDAAPRPAPALPRTGLGAVANPTSNSSQTSSASSSSSSVESTTTTATTTSTDVATYEVTTVVVQVPDPEGDGSLDEALAPFADSSVEPSPEVQAPAPAPEPSASTSVPAQAPAPPPTASESPTVTLPEAVGPSPPSATNEVSPGPPSPAASPSPARGPAQSTSPRAVAPAPRAPAPVPATSVNEDIGGDEGACPDETQTVELHNQYRWRHDAPPLTHSDSLAAAAASYAAQLAANSQCVLEHSAIADRPDQGENLYAYWSDNGVDDRCAEAVAPWYNEVSMYDFSNASAAVAELEPVGHFTQLVWAASTSIGCGYAIGADAQGRPCKVVACRYSPPGNVMDPAVFEANVAPPSDPSSCPDREAMLDAANTFREAHDSQPLRWSDELAQSASELAASVGFSSDCSLAAGMTEVPLPGGVGQATYINLGEKTLGDKCEGAVDAWYRQAASYDFADPGANLANVSAVAGFVQLVWAGTGEVGCGLAVGRAGSSDAQQWCEAAVCRYRAGAGPATEQALTDNVRPPPQPDGTCSDGSDILDRHNAYRRVHGAPPLLWSPGLEANASAWSSELAGKGCVVATMPPSLDPSMQEGQNVYAFSSQADVDGSCKGAVDAWYQEGALYAWDTSDPSTQSPDTVGHFTQVVWKGTTSLGCGSATGRNSDGWPCKVVTCLYTPAGNSWQAQDLADNVGAPEGPVTGMCPNGTSSTGAADAAGGGGLLGAINQQRSLHGAEALSWDLALARTAAAAAAEALEASSTCTILTSTPSSEADGHGETMWSSSGASSMSLQDTGVSSAAAVSDSSAKGSAGPGCPADAVATWYSQAQHFNWTENSQNLANLRNISNFVQLVWKAETAVGCGYASTSPVSSSSGDSCTVVVCHWDSNAPATADAAALEANVGAPAEPEGSCNDSPALLDSINNYRAQHSTLPVAWSADLAADANAWSSRLAAGGCKLQASTAEQRMPGTGETVFGITSTGDANTSCVAAAQHWYSQASAYNFTDTAANLANFAAIGEFSQLVWASTTEVGCGVATGVTAGAGGSWPCKVVTCRWRPPGNINNVTLFEQNVLPPANTSSLPRRLLLQEN